MNKNLLAFATRTSWSSWSSLWSWGALRTRTKFHLHFWDHPHCVKGSLILTSFPSSPGSPYKRKQARSKVFKIFKIEFCSSLQNLGSQAIHQILVGLLVQVNLVILAVPRVQVHAARRIHPRVEPPPLQDQEAQEDHAGQELQVLLSYQEILHPNFPVKTCSRLIN